MPVVRDVPLSLSAEQVLCRRGDAYSARLQPRMIDILHELLATAGGLLEPAFSYEWHQVAQVGGDRIHLGNGTVLHSSPLAQSLARARELAAAVCTIGPGLEEQVAVYFAQDEPLRGLVLDDIGSVALDSLTTEACRLIGEEATSRGYQASGSLSPGMPGWSVAEQHQLLPLVPAEQVGVRLTSGAMMAPRKSLSMVIGMGPDMPRWTQAGVCARCPLRETCAYRVSA